MIFFTKPSHSDTVQSISPPNLLKLPNTLSLPQTAPTFDVHSVAV
jgi:hypothetical protein